MWYTLVTRDLPWFTLVYYQTGILVATLVYSSYGCAGMLVGGIHRSDATIRPTVVYALSGALVATRSLLTIPSQHGVSGLAPTFAYRVLGFRV